MTILDEPVRGGVPDMSVLGYPGRRRLEMFGSEMPFPPYAHLIGVRVAEIDDGRTVITMPATDWLLSPQGRIPLGVLAALADASFGSAMESRLPGGILYTTSEMSLNRLGTPVRRGMLRATGTVVYEGADVGLCASSIVDDAGSLVAYGTSRVAMFPPIDELSTPPETAPPFDPPVFDSPDPFERDAPVDLVSDEVWETLSGREILERQIAGALPAAPLSHLIGLRPVACSDGSATVTMPAHPWLSNHTGSIFGGFIATLADAALQMAVQSVSDAGRQFAPLDFKVNYLRPANPDGREFTAIGSVIHRGRTNAVATAEVLNADGKRVAVATGAAMFRPVALL